MSLHSNLTLDAKLIVPAPELNAAPFHHLVVFEESSKGKIFLETLPPGDVFRPKWFRKKTGYSAFQVSAEPEYWHRCSRFLSTLDHLHSFSLDMIIKLRVDDPRVLVEARARDPLRLVEDRIFESLSVRVRELSWENIWEADESFRESAQVDAGELNLTTRHFGVLVLDVQVERRLPDEAVAPGATESIRVRRILDTTEAEKRLLEQRKEHQTDFAKRDARDQAEIVTRQESYQRSQEIEALNHENRLREIKESSELQAMEHGYRRKELDLTETRKLLPLQQTVQSQNLKAQIEARGGLGLINAIGAIEDMLNQAKSSVQSFPEMRRALQELQGVKEEIGYLASSGTLKTEGAGGPDDVRSKGSLRLLGSEESARLLGPEVQIGLWAILEDLGGHFLHATQATQVAVLPAVLRLLASGLEVLPQAGNLEAASPEKIIEHTETSRRGLKMALSEASELLDDEQVAFLRRLGDSSWLLEHLETPEDA